MNLYKILFICLATFYSLFLNATELQKIKLQLQWKHQFEFAGFYAAKEKGFYKEMGLDISFIEYKSDDNIVSKVLNKDADFGLTYSSLIADYLDNKPVELVANYFKQSPLVLITQEEIKNPSYLKGKNVMGVSDEIDAITLKLMLEKFGIGLNEVNNVKASFQIKDFIDKKVDAMAVFTTNEIYQLDKLGVKYNIFNPSVYGHEYYDLNLFTSKEFLSKNPVVVSNFKEASNKGWKYALENKKEIVDIILNKYNSQNKTKDALLFEANQIEHLMLSKVHPIGSIDENRVKLIANNFIEAGYAKSNRLEKLEEFIFQNKDLILTKEERAFLDEHSNIKVYMDYAYPPYSILEKEELKGFSVEYANLLSSLLGVKFEYTKTMTWDDALTNIKDKKIDVIAQMVNTKERREFTRFTQNYYNYFTGIVTNKKNQHLKTLSSLNGKTVGLVKGYYEEGVLRKHYPEIKIKTYKDNNKLFSALLNDEFDATIGIYQVIEYTINKLGLKNQFVNIPMQMEPVLGTTQEAFGIRKDWPLLQSAMMKAISLTSTDRERIERKWLSGGDSSLGVTFTKEESDYLKQKEFISICIDPSWYPFEKLDNGKHTGMSYDYFKLFEKEIKIPFHLVSTNSWGESLDSIKNKICDILPLAMKTQSREEYLNFTEEYLSVPLVIATKKDLPFIQSLDVLKDKKIGIVKEHAFNEILRKKYPDIQIVNVKNVSDGLAKVENGELFGFVDALASISHQFQNALSKDLQISGRFDERWELSVAVRDDDVLLLNIFQKLVGSISDDMKQKILNKYISVRYEKGIDNTLLYRVLIVIFILSLFFLYRHYSVRKMNKKLKKEVEEQVKKSREKDNLIFHQNKLIAMGEMIENIAHQWRQPLSQVNSAVLVIDDELDALNIKNNAIDNKLMEIESLTKYMSSTIEDFRKFYLKNEEKEEFLLDEAIRRTILIIKSSFDKYCININVKLEKNCIFQGYQNELQQVLLIIFNNAKDIISSKNIQEPIVDISLIKEENKYIIKICDNAGGIDNLLLEKIFEPYFTTKHKSHGTGLGLYISKMLIEERVDGILYAKNINDGACFYIELERNYE